jgi:prevent-host-death family protein
MKKAGIAALKNNLSRYLDQVKSGETILVMDRNQPVAQIVPLPSAARGLVSDDDRLSRLERKGLIRRAVPGHNKWLAKHRPVKVKGSVLQGLLDERGSGWWDFGIPRRLSHWWLWSLVRLEFGTGLTAILKLSSGLWPA